MYVKVKRCELLAGGDENGIVVIKWKEGKTVIDKTSTNNASTRS